MYLPLRSLLGSVVKPDPLNQILLRSLCGDGELFVCGDYCLFALQEATTAAVLHCH